MSRAELIELLLWLDRGATEDADSMNPWAPSQHGPVVLTEEQCAAMDDTAGLA